ncbi:MAG: ATP-binding protein [Saprospiraceae bacterium]
MEEGLLIGRAQQKKIFKEALASKKSEFIVVYGRRRVGKTYLIKQILGQQIDFEMTGIQDGDLSDQLENFQEKYIEFSGNEDAGKPVSWMKAFNMLKRYLSKLKPREQKVIFLDELPWIDTHKSKFLGMLGHFWNDWAVYNKVLLVVCGSAASWMIKNVLNNKGGLHNRATQYIPLQPFNLLETEQFLQAKKIKANRYQVVQLYMALGGIPYYLDLLKPSQSIPQNIDRLCFDTDGFLRNEFDRLFKSLFEKADKHIAVVKALATKWKGLTRKEIATLTGLSNAGSLNRILDELERSAFIQVYFPFGKKKKGSLFRLTDNFSLFYLKLIAQRNLRNQQNVFLKIFTNQAFKIWCGYTFENTCFIHYRQIAKALGIAAIFHEFSSFQFQGNDTYNGIQIDLLIDRADGVINLCEVKFANANYKLTPAYKQNLRERADIFAAVSKTRKSIFTTLITTYGLHNAAEHVDVLQNVLTLDDLFQD